jgi:hypothetical protein
MKLVVLTVCAILSVPWACPAPTSSYDPGAPEIKEALRCEIRLGTNSVTVGSRFPIFLTVENTGTLEAELPAPYSSEMNMRVRAFLFAGQVTGAVQRLIIPCVAVPSDLPPKQRDILEKNRAESWQHLLETFPPSWISIPGHGKAESVIFVEMTPRADNGEALSLAAGTYGLQCEVEYFMYNITSAAFMGTNQWTSAEAAAKAKASGLFLLDMHRLWTGKMESNIVPINIIDGAK